MCLPYQSMNIGVSNLVPGSTICTGGERQEVQLDHTVDKLKERKNSMKFKLRLQCSLIPRLSPHANLHTTSDRKLGRAWEQGYLQCAHSTHTPQLVGYLHCLSFVLTMHTYTHAHRVLISRFSSLLDLTQKLYTRRHSNWLPPSHHRHRHYRHQALNSYKKLTSNHLL